MKGKLVFQKMPAALWVIIALVVSFGAWEIAKDDIVPKRWGVVERGRIYRSGRIAPHLMRQALAEHDIKVIIDLTDCDPQDPSVIAEQKAAEELGIIQHNFPLCGDGTGNITNYANAIAALALARNEKKPVLIHCAAGAQRTGGVIAAYRLLVEKQLPSTVYAEMKRYGWKPSKDKALLEYLNAHMEDLLRLLQDMRVVRRERRPIPQLAH